MKNGIGIRGCALNRLSIGSYLHTPRPGAGYLPAANQQRETQDNNSKQTV